MKKIPLTHGHTALVDDEDFEKLSKLKWFRDSKGYAVHGQYRPGRSAANIKMHRLILDAPAGMWVDHKNGNRLDNRRCNIRLATPSQNVQNCPPNSRNTTGYKGVSYRLQTRRWRAHICLNGKIMEIGSSFKTPEEAARAYDKKARELFGSFAKTNF